MSFYYYFVVYKILCHQTIIFYQQIFYNIFYHKSFIVYYKFNYFIGALYGKLYLSYIKISQIFLQQTIFDVF